MSMSRKLLEGGEGGAPGGDGDAGGKGGGGGGGGEPSVVLLTITLNNEADLESSTFRQLLGYTAQSTGVAFSDKNAVAELAPGGLAAREGLLHVGDTVLAVNGVPLRGQRVALALNAKPRAKYELTVARSVGGEAEGGGGAAGRVHGAHAGWVAAVRAREGAALSGWPRKHWAVLDAAKGVLHLRESSRAAGRHARAVDLRGGLCKAPVMRLRGQELQQPPVIAGLLSQRRFPFTLAWENGEVDHDLILATATSADRSGWLKALNGTLRALKAAAPTSGWLVKEGGRTKAGLAAMLSRDKRRWFVLSQPEAGANATFCYYAGPPPTAGTPPRGFVVLNRDTALQVDEASRRQHAFAIASQGASDARPITTRLAAESQADATRWMKALRLAVSASGGEVASLQELADESRAKTRRLQRVPVKQSHLEQLAALDEEQLGTLRLKQLYEVAEHMAVPGVDAGEKRAAGGDRAKEGRLKKHIVDLIVTQRATHALQEAFEPAHPALKTWGSRGLVHAAIGEEQPADEP